MNRRLNRYVATGLMLLASAGCNAIFGFDERSYDPCSRYCGTMTAECREEAQQYLSFDVCMTTCELLEPGEPDSIDGDTVECRFSELQAVFDFDEGSLERKEVCTHAGFGSSDLGGLGSCSESPCHVYCEVLAVACGQEFRDEFDNDEETCLSACDGLPFDPNFDPSQADLRDRFDTVQCRLWHLANATEKPSLHCGHAVGEGLCAEELPPPP